LENGDLNSADNMMRSVLAINNMDHRAHVMLAVIALKQNHPNEAMAYSRQAIVNHPYGVPAAYYNLGVALDRVGDKERAIAAYRAALFLQEEYVDSHNNLGALLAESGNLAEGIIHLERATQLDSEQSRTFVNLANAYRQLGGVEKSLQAARKAVDIDPNSLEAAYVLSTALLMRGDTEGALNESQRVLELDPSFWLGYDLLSEVLYRRGTANQKKMACDVIATALNIIEPDETTPMIIQRARARGCDFSGQQSLD